MENKLKDKAGTNVVFFLIFGIFCGTVYATFGLKPITGE